MQTIFSKHRKVLRRRFYVSVRKLVRERDPGFYTYAVHTSRDNRLLGERLERVASLTWLGTYGRTLYRVNVLPKWAPDPGGKKA
jgi:hypothetical protein